MEEGTREALQRLIEEPGELGGEIAPQLYSELRRIAASFLRREREDHTLDATALVHEAWIKLAGQEGASLEGQAHFRAVASQAMRRILVDHARTKMADKRKADRSRVTLSGLQNDGRAEVDVLGLDVALERLGAVSERQARVVEMRFFGGLGMTEISRALGVSIRTVEGDWKVARAWLGRELQGLT